MQRFVTCDIHSEGYAVVAIAREPVNSMNLDVWRQLDEALQSLEANPQVRGVIFASALQKDVFTAGNDLLELYAPKTSFERYREFWVTQNEFLARLYRSPLVTVAAIRGASPAGGCVLALCCDHRVMTDFGQIGLNEVGIGIAVPRYWAGLMVKTIGQRQAEACLLAGTMPNAAEALRLGLVDALVPKDGLLDAARASVLQLAAVPALARRQTKESLRGDYAMAWAAYCRPEAEGAWGMLSAPATIKAMDAVFARLSKPKA